MNEQEMKVKDIRDTAIKLEEIRSCFPEDYFYLKGYIHALSDKEKREKASVE